MFINQEEESHFFCARSVFFRSGTPFNFLGFFEHNPRAPQRSDSPSRKATPPARSTPFQCKCSRPPFGGYRFPKASDWPTTAEPIISARNRMYKKSHRRPAEKKGVERVAIESNRTTTVLPTLNIRDRRNRLINSRSRRMCRWPS